MAVVKITVTDSDGKEHVLTMSEAKAINIIDLAEEAGIELPYSCCSGACYTCCAQINKGGQWLEQNKTWEQLIDTEKGEFLCCIWGIKDEAFDGDREKEIEIKMLN